MDSGEEVITHLHIGLLGWKSQETGTWCPNEIIPIEEMEKLMIKRALDEFGGSLEGKKQAASSLRISLATLYNKMKKFDY